MKTLSLQIDKKCFDAILSGKQKVEHRYIYPSNAKRYVTETETTDENGEQIFKIDPIQYDALILTNGRRNNAPRMTIEVVDEEFVILTDEDGNDLTYVENGVEYLVCQIWFHLGNILSTENV